MTIRKVLRAGWPLLRQKARGISQSEIGSGSLESLINDMIETMHEENGVGLAAPQVQSGLRLLVYQLYPNPRYPELDEEEEPRILINPEITKKSAELITDQEGCLSYPDLRAEIPRHQWIRVTARDRSGQEISFKAEGFEARVIQHEIDHLNGHLLVDRVSDLETLVFDDVSRRFRNDEESEDS